MIVIRQLEPSDLTQTSQIDVSEEGTQKYMLVDGQLHIVDEAWTRPRWDAEDWQSNLARWARTLKSDGYLGAFAIMRALDVRAGTGRGARIALSLAGMAHWLRDMTAQIDPIPDPPEHNPRSKEIASELTQLDTVFGRVTTLRPALDVPWRNRVWAPSVRLGTHAPQWSDA